MSRVFTPHHLGIAVANFEQAVAFYTQALGFQVISGPFDDPIQNVRLCFLAASAHDASLIELICPLDRSSPVNGYLSKGIGAYHVCYEVADVAEALAELRGKGSLVVSNPVPAVAFNGRSIAWCFTPTKQLVELVEGDSRVSPEPLGSRGLP